MKKYKLIALALLAVLLVTLIACGTQITNEQTKEEPAVSSVESEASAEESSEAPEISQASAKETSEAKETVAVKNTSVSKAEATASPKPTATPTPSPSPTPEAGETANEPKPTEVPVSSVEPETTPRPTEAPTPKPTVAPTPKPTEKPHEHNWTVSTEVAATCTNAGKRVYKCNCGATREEAAGDPLGHQWTTVHHEEIGHTEDLIQSVGAAWCNYEGCGFVAYSTDPNFLDVIDVHCNPRLGGVHSSSSTLGYTFINLGPTWVVDIPAYDSVECSVCGATQ